MTDARNHDFSPLVTAIPPGAVRHFRRSVGRDPAYSSVGSVSGIALIAIVVVILLVVSGSILRGAVGMLFPEGPSGTVSLVAATLVALAALGLGIVVAIVLRNRMWERWYRLHSFAAANGLVFVPRSTAPSYPGLIFGRGSSRRSTARLLRMDGRRLEYGNYQYTTGSGKQRSTHTWGYLALELDRDLPHMVLDATSNNNVLGSNLPTTFRNDQILSLEGDFDRYFRLYCPREYERDALYIFTPDLMGLLIDEAAHVDVEIIDRWLLLYSSVPFALHEPAIQARLMSIVDTVGSSTLRQTRRYRDERAGLVSFADHRVAPQGQRLAQSVPISAVVIFVAVAGIFVIPQILARI
jgi:hypothetical protein